MCLALLSLLSGCSAIRIAYAQGPELAYWTLDGYIGFNADQKPAVRDALGQWFAWHRRTQLPDYANQLARAETEVLADTTPARVCEWQAELTQRVQIAFERIVPAAASTVLTITPDQIAHLERHNAEANDKFRDDYLQRDPAKRARATLDRTVDRIETIYGRIDAAQRQRIAALLATSPFDPEVWLAERRQRQLDVVQMLRAATTEGATRVQAEAALRLIAQQLVHSPREPYARYVERLDSFNCRFAAETHNAMSPAQRRHAHETLAGWEGDLRSLAAGATPAP